MLNGQTRLTWAIGSLLVIVVAGIAFAAGYLVSSNNKRDTPPADHTLVSDVATEASQSTHSHTNTRPEPRTLLEFEDIANFDSYLARSDTLNSLVSKSDAETLRQLLDQSKNLGAPGFRMEAQSRIIQRLTTLDRKAALDLVMDEIPTDSRPRLLDVVFREWSLANLDQAIDRAMNLDEVSRRSAVESIVLSREDLSNEQRREIARRFDLESVAIEVVRRETNVDIIDSPQLAWDTFINKNYDQLQDLSEPQSKMLESIVHSWVVRDGIEVFDKMRSTLPTSFSLLQTAHSLAHELLSGNPQLAIDLVAHLAQNEQETGYVQLATELAILWAESDPRGALETTLEIDSRSLQRKMQSQILRAWGESDPHMLVSSLGSLPPDLQERAFEQAAIAIAAKSPEIALEMASDITDQAIKDHVASQIAAQWAKKDISAALNWIDTDTSLRHIRDDLKRTAFRELADVDPQLALQTAQNQPLGPNRIGWEGAVINSLVVTNMDVAVAMLDNVRPGATRIDAYDSVVVFSLFERDPERALESFLELCELEEIKTSNWALSYLSNDTPRQLFASIDSIRSEESKTNVARALLRNNEDNGLFSEAEQVLLRQIAEEDRPEPASDPIDRLQQIVDRLRKEEAEEEEESE